MNTYGKNDPAFFGGSARTERPVVGMRNWRIDTMFRLTGVIYKDSIWVPGENRALCRAEPRALTNGYYAFTAVSPTQSPKREPDHTMDECPHGFYAYYDGSRDYHERGDVTGIIQGYGEAVIGTKGFRCMKARILAFKFSKSIPAMVQNRITALYPDVAVFRSLDQMLAEYPTTADGHEYQPETDADFWTKGA